MIAHLKLLIAKLQRNRFGPISGRSRRLLDQLELQLEELEADAAEAEAKQAEPAAETSQRRPRAKAGPWPVTGPSAARAGRRPGPTECPGRQGKLSKLGETITETLEVIPRQWKVMQTVRQKFTCRACETVTEPPAPFHPIARGRAGPELLAMILEQSSASICRSTDRARPTPARISISTSPHLAAGLAPARPSWPRWRR